MLAHRWRSALTTLVAVLRFGTIPLASTARRARHDLVGDDPAGVRMVAPRAAGRLCSTPDRYRPFSGRLRGAAGPLLADREWGFGELALGACILLAAGGIAFGASGATSGDPYTELSLLTENESGELTASGYPANLTVDAEETVTVLVGSHENGRTNYTLVAVLERAETRDGRTSVSRRVEIDRYDLRLSDGEEWRHRQRFSPLASPGRQRVAFLLYQGGAPAKPTVDTADESVFLWLNVSENGSASPSR